VLGGYFPIKRLTTQTKQEDALSPLLFNYVGLKLNGTHQLLADGDDVNLQASR
jgi:hypothetical protein